MSKPDFLEHLIIQYEAVHIHHVTGTRAGDWQAMLRTKKGKWLSSFGVTPTDAVTKAIANQAIEEYCK